MTVFLSTVARRKYALAPRRMIALFLVGARQEARRPDDGDS